MSSPYYLSIDVRAELVTAAVAVRTADGSVRTFGAALDAGPTMPTAVFVARDEVLFGADALAGAADEPDRLIRDVIPGEPDAEQGVVVDGQRFARADLFAWLVDAVATTVAVARGEVAQGIWVVVPAWWSDARVDAIAAALDRDGHADVDFVSVPEALTSRFSSMGIAESPLTVVVCDVDDDILAASIVRVSTGRTPQAIGASIMVPVTATSAVDDDPERSAVAEIAVALERAQVPEDEVDAIILSGRSGRLDRVEQLLIEQFGEPIDRVAEPALASALGAALALAYEHGGIVPAAVPVATAVAAAPTITSLLTATSDPVAEPLITAPAGPARAWFRRPAGIAAIGIAAAGLVAAAGVGAVFAFGGASDDGADVAIPTRSPSVAQPTGTPLPTATPTPSATPQPSPTPSPSVPVTVPNPFDTMPPVTPPLVAAPVVPVAPEPPIVAPEQPVTPVVPPVPEPEPEPEPEPPVEVAPTPTPTPTETVEPLPTPTVTDEAVVP